MPMLAVLKNFWEAVSQTFPEAWAISPRKSRLMHGVGIVSLGFVMDASVDRRSDVSIPTVEQFVQDLTPLRPIYKWTAGYWNFGDSAVRRWNELQNTQKDIQLLTSFLLSQYRLRVRTEARGSPLGDVLIVVE